MERVNIDILGISELKWTGMGEFNSDDHYIRRRQMAPHSSTVAQKIPWMEKPGGLQSMGSHRVGHDWSNLAAVAVADHYIYYCGQESLRRNGVAIIVNKRVWNAVLGCNLKNDRMISVCFQGKPLNITKTKSMPQPLMVKKPKLNGSMKTYKTF